MLSSFVRISLGAACVIMIFAASSSGVARASSSAQAAVFRQEARWFAALLNGDRDTIASILRQNYKHIDSKGRLFNRTQELAGITKEQGTMKWNEQTINFAGNVAVVHGVNTITQSHNVSRERYTDVYVEQDGVWLAVSAQETAIAP